MDAEQTAKAATLIEGNIKQGREEIEKGLVKLTLSYLSRGDQVNSKDIKYKCSSKHGVKINQEKIDKILHELKGEYTEEGEDGNFLLLKEISYNTFGQEIEPLWEEYTDVLSLFREDLDPYYKKQIKPAFKLFFKEFLTEITSSIEKLSEYQKETIYTDFGRTDQLIEKVIEKEDITTKQVFRDSITEYITESGTSLLSFTESLYNTAVNVDLLNKADETIEFPELPARNKNLILDTNFLVALLADSESQHHIAKVICERSNDLGFDLCYLDNTREELNNFISNSEHEMSGIFSGDNKIETANSQFVKDYRNKTEIGWDKYISNIKDWEEKLQEKYDIELFGKDTNPNEEVEESVKERLMEANSFNLHQSDLDKIKHDANLVGVTANERQFTAWNFGPFVLSFHQKLAQIGNELADEDDFHRITGGKPLALQPRSFLNYLMAFTPAEVDPEDKGEIAESVIRIAADFDKQVDMDEYVHVLAPKVGVEKESEEQLKRLLLNHPSLSEELKDAVQDNEGHKAERLSREILSDNKYIEAIEEEREFEERIKSASSMVNDLQDEKSKLKSKLPPESEEFRSKYEKACTKYIDLTTSDPLMIELEDPPASDADILEIKQWLQTATIRIDNSQGISGKWSSVNDDLELLLADAIKITKQ